MKHKKILIAEDESLVRQGIVAILKPDVGEIVEASNGEEALKLLKAEKFDIALLDIGLPVRTGLDVMAELKQRNVDVKIIILTGETNIYAPDEIFAAGADDFIYKTADAEDFLNRFKKVALGIAASNASHGDFGNTQANKTEQSVAQLRSGLTARELQIVKILVEGANNKEAAKALFISEHTVRKHREHINRKLNIKSPTALAAFAIKANLV